MATYDKEFIIRYADDELSEEERRQFEADLRTDPSLAAEVSLYRELKTTLQQRLPVDEGAAALRSTVEELNKKHFAPPAQANPALAPIRRIPTTRWLAGAAAAIVIAASIYLLLPSSSLESLGRTEMINTTERGANTDTLLQQAAVFFNQQDFAKALPLLDKAVQSDSSQLALFYRGIAEWHTHTNEAARKDLAIIYNSESLLRYEAAFYIALTYASEKNNPSALEWLQKIPEGTPVSDRAKTLENKLK
ncbi:MAG TPA: hypothetical protein VI233_07420 [Puia sp.]